MFHYSSNVSIYVSDRYVDFRKSFDGLCGEVENFMGHNPMSGHVFVFYNKRRDKIKLLFFDRDGYWIHYKRLERGTFEKPFRRVSGGSFSLSHQELLLILSGIELGSIRTRKRYKLSA